MNIPKVKSSMNSLDISVLAREMRQLEGAYIEKAFGERQLRIRFNTGEGKRELVYVDGPFLFLSRPLEFEEELGSFAQTLRRVLSNSRVLTVYQRGFDRLIEMSFSRPENSRAVIELMGRGNLLILHEDRIIACRRSERRGQREIKQGEQYAFPEIRFDITRSDFESFSSTVRNSRADIIRTLATQAGLGGDVAEEICIRSGRDASEKASEVKEEELREIYSEILNILEEAKNPVPVVYYSEGHSVSFSPLPFRKFEELEKRRFSSISEAIIEFLNSRPQDISTDEVQRRKLLERQREAIAAFRRGAEALRRYADGAYADFSSFSSMVESIRKGGTEIRKERDGSCILRSDGAEIRIKPEMEINSIISGIYDSAKEMERKAERAEQALREMMLKESAVSVSNRIVARERRKQFWFEQYRWFISSGGKLVIAGRDAKTNERAVAKHMGQGDLYVHADIHGAPSVVVKGDGEIDQGTVEEACTFAVCFSRAWNAKIGSAAAYWVLPDQVSKTPESGEYLPKGAFVIRGRRNYVTKVSLQLAVGEIEYQGVRKLNCAPVSAIQAHTKDFMTIVPGEERKEKIASIIAAHFGYSTDEAVAALPPGRSAIVGGQGTAKM